MMPARFELTYTGEDNADHQPVMIHRALFGSFERLIGILIEHYGGDFPLWLAPVQAIVLPIADRHLEYATRVYDQLRERGVRGELDERSESISKKVRDAELQRIPFMLIVGDREVEGDVIAVREHRVGDTGTLRVADFAAKVGELVSARAPRSGG
jgi:threonyl-tRNA synthetase